MPNYKYLSIIFVAALAVTACGGGGKTQTVAEDTDTVAYFNPDENNTIFGVCGEGTTMNTLELITDNGDTLFYNIEKAIEEGMVIGGLNANDHIGVTPDMNTKEVREVINITSMQGNWFMPNPIDGSSVMGLSFRDGGICEGINQSTQIYRTWKIFNGKLQLTVVREGGNDEEELLNFYITKLDKDSLVMEAVHPEENEDPYRYARTITTDGLEQIEMPEY